MKLKGKWDRRRENCFLTTYQVAGEWNMSRNHWWNNNGGDIRSTQRIIRTSDSHFIHQKPPRDWLGSGCDPRRGREATDLQNHPLTKGTDLGMHPHAVWLVVRSQQEKCRTYVLIL
jgi:hypothetical protein